MMGMGGTARSFPFLDLVAREAGGMRSVTRPFLRGREEAGRSSAAESVGSTPWESGAGLTPWETWGTLEGPGPRVASGVVAEATRDSIRSRSTGTEEADGTGAGGLGGRRTGWGGSMELMGVKEARSEAVWERVCRAIRNEGRVKEGRRNESGRRTERREIVRGS
jgi:hypothetical protein